ncbi:uncharacterized protein [Pyxicephalus adspersus]|uniref:uncharacterized protein isoform X2 n=1 Tax=Pyxicephalus adspersus TaxID=30357 RepID=UPI003B5A868A
MDGRLKSILEEALQSITTKSLESFKSKLQEKKLEGYPKIGRSNLEDTNAEKLVDLICRHYTIENAPKVIESILLEINERQAHLDLTKTLETALKDQGYGEAKAQMLDWGISDGMMKPEKDTFAIKEMNIREKTPRKGVHLDRTNHASEPSSSHHIPQTEINECENHQSVTNIDSSSNLTTENWPVHQKQKSAKKNTPWKIKLKRLTETDIQCMKEDHQQQPVLGQAAVFGSR